MTTNAKAKLQNKMEMNVTSGVKWPRFVRRVNPFLVTGFTMAILALFLMPFLYMVFTSLKTNRQMTISGAPIWPAKSSTYTLDSGATGAYTVKVSKSGTLVDQAIDLSEFAGKELDIYTVPLEDGTTKNLALLKGFQKGSIFIDPENPGGGPIVWNGGFFKTLPRPWIVSPTWQNYKEMWDAINFPRALSNTFFYAFITTIGVLVSCVPVAYGFSRFRFPGRDILFVLLISIIFLPLTVTVIPTFTFFAKIGWVGTWLPLIIPSFFTNAYDTFLLRQYFMTLPRELDESAMIDGAGPLRILWSVIIPQSYPVIVAVTVFHLVWAWNDYFGPLIYLSTNRDKLPVSVVLSLFNGMYGQRPELIQAGALVTLLFPLLLFFIAQRFFVQGIVITGVEK